MHKHNMRERMDITLERELNFHFHTDGIPNYYLLLFASFSLIFFFCFLLGFYLHFFINTYYTYFFKCTLNTVLDKYT